MVINYKKKNRLKKYTIFSNLIIVFLLCSLIAITSISSYSYVFNYDNENIFYNGDKSTNKISLMVNVYWGNEFIEPMLDIFSKYNVKTTFFVGGSWVEKNGELFSKIIENGHEIGNHGYFHKDHSKMNYEQNYEEIQSNHQLVNVNYGIEMNLFAPPSGAFNNSTLNASKDLGYSTIMWSKDTIDWRDHNSNLIIERATKNISGGDFILMHPTKETVDSLVSILENYKINNIEVSTVSTCLNAKKYAI